MEYARPVIVHHNIATDDDGTPIGALGYVAGQPVVPVYRYVSTIHDDSSTEDDYDIIAEEAFWLFGVGHTPGGGPADSRTLLYHEKGNRPLAVGDVLCITDTWWACTPTGWNSITKPVLVKRLEVPVEGTTPVTGRRRGSRAGTPGWTVYTGSNG